MSDVAVRSALHAVDDLHSVLASADGDPALYNVSLPRGGTVEGAVAWATHHDWRVWVVLVDSAPAGVLHLGVPELTTDAERFADCWETGTYLLPDYRGHGIATTAWRQVYAVLPAGTRLVGEVWDTNTASIRRLEKAGWTYEGDYWWAGEKESGVCRRYTFTVSDVPIQDL